LILSGISADNNKRRAISGKVNIPLVEPVLISALEHWSYCPRQCGLIHLEAVWDENVFTLRGTQAHERADKAATRSERGKRVERALPIWSFEHGLQGRADVVEFTDGVPMPVEYKSGPAGQSVHARIQLCAQVLCLEEMFRVKIENAALFLVASQKRLPVPIDLTLREKTLSTIAAVRRMMDSQQLPSAKYDKRCRQCSLIDACLPQTLDRARVIAGAMLYMPLTERDLP